MIKLERIDPPEKLTSIEIEKLTNEFKKTNKNVWGKEYIKEQLLHMSNNKCAYCEAPLDISGSYMEIEHFYPKSKYPEKVVEWENLLPSCKRCNIKKGSIDPNDFNIINPTTVNPKEHLSLNRYRIVGLDKVGKNTVQLLNLNDINKLVLNRALIGEVLSEKLESLAEDADELTEEDILSKKMKIRNSMISLLEGVQPQNSYSATLAAILLSDPNYSNIKQFLKKQALWDEELIELESQAKTISF